MGRQTETGARDNTWQQGQGRKPSEGQRFYCGEFAIPLEHADEDRIQKVLDIFLARQRGRVSLAIEPCRWGRAWCRINFHLTSFKQQKCPVPGRSEYKSLEPTGGLEPPTCALRVRCSTS